MYTQAFVWQDAERAHAENIEVTEIKEDLAAALEDEEAEETYQQPDNACARIFWAFPARSPFTRQWLSLLTPCAASTAAGPRSKGCTGETAPKQKEAGPANEQDRTDSGSMALDAQAQADKPLLVKAKAVKGTQFLRRGRAVSDTETSATSPAAREHGVVGALALQARGLPVHRLVHEEGSFVITFPNAYHAGLTQVCTVQSEEATEPHGNMLRYLVGEELITGVCCRRGGCQYRLMHQEGSFVITSPNAYHADFNIGSDCAEAVNFGPPNWLPWDHNYHVGNKYRKDAKAATLSNDALLINLAKAALLLGQMHLAEEADLVYPSRGTAAGARKDLGSGQHGPEFPLPPHLGTPSTRAPLRLTQAGAQAQADKVLKVKVEKGIWFLRRGPTGTWGRWSPGCIGGPACPPSADDHEKVWYRLQARGLPVHRLVHQEGSFAITFPYHAGFKTGVYRAETVDSYLQQTGCPGASMWAAEAPRKGQPIQDMCHHAQARSDAPTEEATEPHGSVLRHLMGEELITGVVTMLSPMQLQARGVPVHRLVHEEGSLVITFASAYHAGFQTEPDSTEAVNFGPPNWLPWDLRSALQRRQI
ncbi:hypothetical protein WJX73_009358 [Symbiochloris irregularis]|uniref:JmjC domain-containing protein n=1 Tax=Symbiochloris irregularis TaxID=706552 RepID=A0AAW1NWZ2_9CHLO